VHAEARTPLTTIAGSIPHPFNRPPGCSFHPRCSERIPGLCDVETPDVRTIGDRHTVSCHLGTDAALAATAASAAGGGAEPEEPTS
jgi:ABC-type dipeptide/oligopeptide/nickel transport system ATPase component